MMALTGKQSTIQSDTGTVAYLANGQSRGLEPLLRQIGAWPYRFDPGSEGMRPRVLVVWESRLQQELSALERLWLDQVASPSTKLIIIEDVAVGPSDEVPPAAVFARLPESVREHQLQTVVQRALDLAGLEDHAAQLQSTLEHRSRALRELNAIGVALSAQREEETLLEMILEKSRRLTNADAGSLYLIEEGEQGERCLRFRLAQNDSVPITDFKQQVLPLNRSSIAGFVALTGQSLRLDDVNKIPGEAEYSFNRSYDDRTGYRTISMMTIAMRDHHGDIVGAIQLINRRQSAFSVGTAKPCEAIVPFTDECEGLIYSLASQAAVAIEKNRLIREIENLFEGFVNAAVLAIEQRDPSTQGHSKRVAVYTVALARAVDTARAGIYRDVRFSPQQVKELRYASLLHDVGKIGVRENVLVKAKKLYDEKLRLIESRFRMVREVLSRETSRRKVELLLEKSREEYQLNCRRLDQQFADELKMIDEYFEMIKLANEPQLLATETGAGLNEIAARTYYDLAGNPTRLLHEDEITILSIPRGSLSEEERTEIESHVTKSFNFLRTIPWTRDLKGIPDIAHAHHEKLDGSGYPRRLTGPDIPIQARMMTIADIYDALTASDRPYKRAVPLERAMDILHDEARLGFIDADLLNVFVEARVFGERE